ncbi:Transcriptional regulatory protein sin3 [Balamuthia mandrillaris]
MSLPGITPGTASDEASSPTAPDSSTSQPPRVTFSEALDYLTQVKHTFREHPDMYNRFITIMRDFKQQTIDSDTVILRAANLLEGQPELLQGFAQFLPPGYREKWVELTSDAVMADST